MQLYYRRRSKLHLSLRGHRYPRGYSLVSVTMVGLVMMLLVMMLIFRTQSEQAVARAQLLKGQSLALAETAAVTYQSFLAHYPDIASLNQNQWSDFLASAPTDCTLASVLKPEDIQQIQAVVNQGTNWQAVNPNNLSQGQVRLVSYQYTPDPGIAANQAPGTAVLQVEGRARAKGLASEALGFGSSRSQVELQFRVDAKPPEEIPAGLVGRQFSATQNPYGSPAISANVCDQGATKSSSSLNAFMTNLTDGRPSKIAYSSTFNTTPPADGLAPFSGAGVYDLGSFAVGAAQTCQLPMQGNTQTTEGVLQGCPTLINEMSTTDSTGRPVYKYNLSQLQLGVTGHTTTQLSTTCTTTALISCSSVNTASSTATTGNARLILGRTGNEVIHLYISGNTQLKQSRITVVPGTRVYLYLHGSFDATDPVPEGFLENTQAPENLQVYMYGASSAGATNFNLNYGHSTTKAVVFAPNASVSLIDVKVDGALWANSVSIIGDSGITQNVEDPGLLKIVVPGRKRINPAFNWQQREVS